MLLLIGLLGKMACNVTLCSIARFATVGKSGLTSVVNVIIGLAKHVLSGVQSVQRAITDIKFVVYAMTLLHICVDAVGSGAVFFVALAGRSYNCQDVR